MDLNTRLFVGNLPDIADEKLLHEAFESFGTITNLDLKTKVESNNAKKFAFVTLSADHHGIESCINHFTTQDFKGNKLYVTRARESFLERLQRERQEAALKDVAKPFAQKLPKQAPVIKLDEKLNPRKRQLNNSDKGQELHHKINSNDIVPGKVNLQHNLKAKPQYEKSTKKHIENGKSTDKAIENGLAPENKKKVASEQKRLESMKKKREEFKQKKMIINTGLSSIDNVSRKKVVFSDSDDVTSPMVPTNSQNKSKGLSQPLFENDDDSGDEVNFSIKEQFEGKKGQKVLELQSRYKSDKRFALDERFVDEDDGVTEDLAGEADEDIDLGQSDEKMKQLNILQDVLGMPIKSYLNRSESTNDKKATKIKLGMLRFDPTQPEHAKFLAPVEETKQEFGKKNKKKKNLEDQQSEPPQQNIEKVEVSKETFYKVSDTLKEAIAQPNTFSLRNLFNRNDDSKQDDEEQVTNFIPLERQKEPKVRHPLDKGEANPFKYDSSDSEAEDETSKSDQNNVKSETKVVWNEKFFFSESDSRLTDGVSFFTKVNGNKGQKDRRELKSLMKKRLYNRERKDQMFKKKIGGRRKSAKKSHRK